MSPETATSAIAAPPPAAIKVTKVTKAFGSVVALDNVSLTVAKGEFFGLLGPNGAGKTTLVRILTGQLSPDSGEGTTMGVPFSDGIAIKRKVGIVPESETPPTFLTVQEFLELVCRLRDLDKVSERVNKWLEFFDIGEKRDVLCRDLSKGQRQKIMLASAFIPEPELLLLDEPFINLDPVFQRKVREYLADHVKKGKTIFMCTHILEIEEKLCTRLAIINRGGIVAMGSLDEIRSKAGERLEDIFIRLVTED